MVLQGLIIRVFPRLAVSNSEGNDFLRAVSSVRETTEIGQHRRVAILCSSSRAIAVLKNKTTAKYGGIQQRHDSIVDLLSR